MVGFYKVRRVGETLLSATAFVAVLAGIWWAVPAERGLATSSAEVATALAACGLVFVPAESLVASGIEGVAWGTVGGWSYTLPSPPT